ncbi:hypothetical protein PtA15_14A356 [Puccinia triticina]|uniref:Uncharacterized protein n=1 Tax=Puccinia triticina TaxID=208348 RepID=A0ABY7D5C0_9BASI|nr:uncharacterized protein PtA15_14A356 [Puccinia triticina]WAQ91472.1 hypothetical protein PtA15_14A356 [Puccinia triticina]
MLGSIPIRLTDRILHPAAGCGQGASILGGAAVQIATGQSTFGSPTPLQERQAKAEQQLSADDHRSSTADCLPRVCERNHPRL